MKYEILTPNGPFESGELDSLTAPAVGGELGVLENHTEMLALLESGPLRIKKGSETSHYKIEGGFLQVENGELHILAEKAEKVS